MKDLLKNTIFNITKAGFEQWLGFIFLSMLIIMCGFFVRAVTADHTIECYYLQAVSGTGYTTHRVFAFTNWQFDEKVFSSVYPQEAMDVLSNLKQCASKD